MSTLAGPDIDFGCTHHARLHGSCRAGRPSVCMAAAARKGKQLRQSRQQRHQQQQQHPPLQPPPSAAEAIRKVTVSSKRNLRLQELLQLDIFSVRLTSSDLC